MLLFGEFPWVLFQNQEVCQRVMGRKEGSHIFWWLQKCYCIHLRVEIECAPWVLLQRRGFEKVENHQQCWRSLNSAVPRVLGQYLLMRRDVEWILDNSQEWYWWEFGFGDTKISIMDLLSFSFSSINKVSSCNPIRLDSTCLCQTRKFVVVSLTGKWVAEINWVVVVWFTIVRSWMNNGLGLLW